ncbi:20397_t:CDS:2 [Cetraspora pellucida]|uniref:20397_t:CDS:1 n=1 Tax=Cetraspora pellucida TaxID=1433469 RepID=A0A9N9I231_9GLOM|nr:20397_t:CDS:2 [Cetraspora pellucida]
MIHRGFMVFIIILLYTTVFGITSASQINQNVIEDILSNALYRRDSSSDTSNSTQGSTPPLPLPGTQFQMPLVVGPTAASSILALCAITILGGGITRMFARKEKNVNILTNNEELTSVKVEPGISTQQYTYI